MQFCGLPSCCAYNFYTHYLDDPFNTYKEAIKMH